MLLHAVILLSIPALIAANCRESIDYCQEEWVHFPITILNEGNKLTAACCAVTGVLDCLERRASGSCQSGDDRLAFNVVKGPAEMMAKQCDIRITADGKLPSTCDGVANIVSTFWRRYKAAAVIGSGLLAIIVVVALVVIGMCYCMKRGKK